MKEKKKGEWITWRRKLLMVWPWSWWIGRRSRRWWVAKGERRRFTEERERDELGGALNLVKINLVS